MSLGQPTEFASAIARSLSKEPFVLLDIGCSGGINPMWRIFGDRLLALGVDPNIEEVERLKARENRLALNTSRRLSGNLEKTPPHCEYRVTGLTVALPTIG